ncbi:cyclophilin-like fold protein [Pseudomonas syringae]|uniref:cyclophilin-like fold protein n=1 Tax=Pseudomonas syringae TaxID=317 RepID=UPI003AF40147
MDSENVDVGKGAPLTSLGTANRSHSWRRRAMQQLGILLLLLALCGGHHAYAANPARPAAVAHDATQTSSRSEELRMWMTVGERRFAITLADNEATRAFAATLPLTLDMEELNGNEKKQELPDALPTSESRPGTIRNGDLMLWGSRTVVIFYQTFDSTYSYTRLGRVDDPTGLAQALGRGDASVVFSRN